MLNDTVFAELRKREYSRLDRLGEAYLDYTGSALYPESQVTRYAERLKGGLFGNPHSENGPSKQSTCLIEEARTRVLEFLDAPPDYSVVFTANTTAAIKLVAEGYRFGRDCSLVLSSDNHNSMNGIREYARRQDAAVSYIPLDSALRLVAAEDHLRTSHPQRRRGLFGMPAQSNFSGVRHPLELVGVSQDLGYDVLLDAAAFLPTNRLSLKETPADFVVFSAYKILGFPTGVGALVAKSKCLQQLERPWFAGGTVEYASIQHRSHLLQAGPPAFEDGTPAFLDLVAVSDGFEFLETIEADRIRARISCLTKYALERLAGLAYQHGEPLTETYGPGCDDDRGGTIAFNVLRRDGISVPFADVITRAREAGVSLRGGCFCNPGAAEAAFGFPAEATARCLEKVSSTGFSITRLSHCLGPDVPVGAVRASFGIPTTTRDIDRAIDVIASFAQDTAYNNLTRFF